MYAALLRAAMTMTATVTLYVPTQSNYSITDIMLHAAIAIAFVNRLC